MSPIPSASDFVPISPNPYIVGNPVRNPGMFFGRESEFELVQKRFKHSGRGSLLVFCGERRSGKTSILLQIQQGRLGPEFIPVLIDMQAMAVEGETEFLSLIAQEIREQLGGEGGGIAPPDFTHGTPSVAFREFIEAVLEKYPHRRLLLLFDEYELFEDKFDNGVLTKDVLHILSNLMENLPTFLVFTGSQHLEERRKEYWRILEKAHEYRRISYLQPADAVRLIEEPVKGRVTYADGTVQRILRLTAGHPFFTQAICMNLVDALNEERSNVVTQEALSAIVEMIVENPFPQMTFLWDTFEREHKLTLALLGERLDTADAYVTAKQLLETLKKGNYPFALSRPAVATALEALFKQEILSKNDARPAGYAFRMDLWRLWIQRMHSAWQVMHEEGMEFRVVHRRRRRAVALAAAGAPVAAVVGWLLWSAQSRTGTDNVDFPDPLTGRAGTGFVGLVVQPPETRIGLDGTSVGVGEFEGRLAAGRPHTFLLTAPGYVDSSLSLAVAPADSLTQTVALRPRRGGLRVEVEPSDAGIWVDGEAVGTGRVELAGLVVPQEHTLEARLDNHETQTRAVRVLPDTTLLVTLRMVPMTQDLNVVTVPDGAEIHLDGQKCGNAPLVVSAIAAGPHRFRAEMAGYVAADTTLHVQASIRHLRLHLAPLPPGILVVRGDRPARIYIDEQQVGSGELPNSGERRVAAGNHVVEVVFRDGSTDRLEVDVAAGSRVELWWEAQKLRVHRDGR